MQIDKVQSYNNSTFGNISMSCEDKDKIRQEVLVAKKSFSSVPVDIFINRHLAARKKEEFYELQNNLVHYGPKETIADVTSRAAEIYKYLLDKCDKYSKDSLIDYVTNRHEQLFDESIEERKNNISTLEKNLANAKLELKNMLENRPKIIRENVFLTMKQKLNALQLLYENSQNSRY